jgi:hypothetical protein
MAGLKNSVFSSNIASNWGKMRVNNGKNTSFVGCLPSSKAVLPMLKMQTLVIFINEQNIQKHAMGEGICPQKQKFCMIS